MSAREMSLEEYLEIKLAVIPQHHRVQAEYRDMKERIAELKKIS